MWATCLGKAIPMSLGGTAIGVDLFGCVVSVCVCWGGGGGEFWFLGPVGGVEKFFLNRDLDSFVGGYGAKESRVWVHSESSWLAYKSFFFSF